MTNLLAVLPDFDLQPYSHIVPSLERALISSVDLISLDALDVAKRAQVPPNEVKKLSAALVEGLHASIHVKSTALPDEEGTDASNQATPPQTAPCISTLDDGIDTALNGGVRTGELSEFVGESAAGKTQFLLTLLLSVQLPGPFGRGKSALYISTEAPLQTSRLSQILSRHPRLSCMQDGERPSLNRVHSTHVHDLEAQDHILRYQVPIVIQRHNVGLLVIDSIAANYRPEFDKGKVRRTAAESFVKRSNQVTQLGELLRRIARTYDVAVVVANQVSDRFVLTDAPTTQHTQQSRPGSPPLPTASLSGSQSPAVPATASQALTLLSTDDPLSLDHQQRFFTGWGDDLSVSSLKTPSLGLAWTNQLHTRVALLREPIIEMKSYKPGEEPNITGWKRTFKVVFSSYSAGGACEFRIAEGGVQCLREGDEDVR